VKHFGERERTEQYNFRSNSSLNLIFNKSHGQRTVVLMWATAFEGLKQAYVSTARDL
jgi:hypothetical protein